MYSSTCFKRPHAHHQELNKSSSSLWFYSWSVAVAVLLVVVGPTIPELKHSNLYFKKLDFFLTFETFFTILNRQVFEGFQNCRYLGVY
jgi:hypothetical protein